MQAHVPALLAALALLAPLVSGQGRRPFSFEPMDGPIGQVHYDLATGRVTKLVRPGAVRRGEDRPAARGAARTVVRGFQNRITTGYYTSGTLGAEFVDWATKATGASLTTKIVFAYGTYENDIQFGGQGASVDLALYEGTTGFCTLGTELPGGRFSFTGLPGRNPTACCGDPDNYFIVTATLAGAVHVPDGRSAGATA